MSAYAAVLALCLALCVSIALGMAAPKPSGFSNTKAGKTAILERTRTLVQSSELIITLPIDGVSKEQIDFLRKDLPKSTKATVVKNALMGIAITDSPFKAMNVEGLRGENMFVFITEGNAKETYKVMKAWAKEYKRNEPHMLPKYAAMDGELFKAARLEAVVNLPTKKELITKIAQGIKAVPTKVALGVKAVPSKVGRAFGALKKKLEDEAEEQQ
jgi:large subunit ribosomal protein L10